MRRKVHCGERREKLDFCEFRGGLGVGRYRYFDV